MANALDKNKQIAVISALAEGSSIRSIERITSVHRDTIMRLGVRESVIRRLHGVEATHVESVPVKETFRGKTVWDGIVEVFELHGHPKAPKVYAWAHDTEDPKRPRREVANSSREGRRGAVN